jgi:hypothetical protein
MVALFLLPRPLLSCGQLLDVVRVAVPRRVHQIGDGIANLRHHFELRFQRTPAHKGDLNRKRLDDRRG